MKQRRGGRLDLGVVAATGVLASVFALLLWRLQLPVRDSNGATKTMRVLDVWLALLDHLPPEAPAFLTRGPLSFALVVALIALAYVFVATLRLRDS